MSDSRGAMRDDVSRAAGAVGDSNESTRERNKRIVEMRKSGITVRAIAAKVSLSRQTVRAIIQAEQRNEYRRAHDPFFGLSVHVVNRLREEGIDTPEQLVERWAASELTANCGRGRRYPRDFWLMPSIGVKGLEEIENWIRARAN